MTKRLIDVDDKLLEQARTALGTSTMKDTVNSALDEVVRSQMRRRHAQRLSDMEGLDLADQDVMSRAWRS